MLFHSQLLLKCRLCGFECSECCEQWKFSHPNMFVATCMQQPSLSEISNRHTIGLITGILDAGRLDGAYESLDRIVRF
jgi:hypothetical protein